MRMKLYVYDHCPYCVKARMIFGIKDVPFTLNILRNDDEATPISMVGKKVVPILEKADGQYMPESMDIVRYIDALDGTPILRAEDEHHPIAAWCAGARDYLYALAMPRWVCAPLEEFATESARSYFIHKKEQMIGNFSDLIQQSEGLIEQANQHLLALEPLLHNDHLKAGWSEHDIHLFAILRSLSIVRGLRYPTHVDAYRTEVAQRTHIPLHDEYAS